MSDNNDTEYRARELKSVHLNASGKILKILVHEPHTNKHNKHQQVGLVAIGLYGIPQTAEQVLLDEVIDRNLKITPDRNHSETPPKSGASRSSNPNNLDSLMFDPQLGPALPGEFYYFAYVVSSVYHRKRSQISTKNTRF